MARRLRPAPLLSAPSVTVVVPCYNYGHFLPTAVTSVLEQVGVTVDVIIVDDASSDGSTDVVRRLTASDDRVRAILHRQNRGHIATFNEGLDAARGEYVVLLSADDALTPGALARATALLEAHPSVGFVYGHPFQFVDELPAVPTDVRNWTIWSGLEWIARRCQSGRNCIMNPEVVMRTSVQHAIGGYDRALPHSGDLEMWLRAASVADVARVNGPPQGFYRVHSGSMQRTVHAGHVIDLEERLAAFQKLLIGPEARVRPGGEALFATARRALAESALECAQSAYDHGRAIDEPVDEYLAFAARVWPESSSSRRRRALTRRASSDSTRQRRRLGSASRRLAESVRWRVRWRRWRWSGV